MSALFYAYRSKWKLFALAYDAYLYFKLLPHTIDANYLSSRQITKYLKLLNFFYFEQFSAAVRKPWPVGQIWPAAHFWAARMAV